MLQKFLRHSIQFASSSIDYQSRSSDKKLFDMISSHPRRCERISNAAIMRLSIARTWIWTFPHVSYGKVFIEIISISFEQLKLQNFSKLMKITLLLGDMRCMLNVLDGITLFWEHETRVMTLKVLRLNFTENFAISIDVMHARALVRASKACCSPKCEPLFYCRHFLQLARVKLLTYSFDKVEHWDSEGNVNFKFQNSTHNNKGYKTWTYFQSLKC